MKDRAETDKQKQEIVERLLNSWKLQRELRLGQLLYCATGGRDIFNVEDYVLIKEIENFQS